MVSDTRDNPPPSYLGRGSVAFALFLFKIQPAVYIRIANSSRGGGDNSGGGVGGDNSGGRVVSPRQVG